MAKIKLTFPQAFALCTWDFANNALPKHTDGMVRKALQNKGIVDAEKALTPLGKSIVDSITAVLAEAMAPVGADQQRGTVKITADNALAVDALVDGGFAIRSTGTCHIRESSLNALMTARHLDGRPDSDEQIELDEDLVEIDLVEESDEEIEFPFPESDE